jgi:tetratricopeptide (TPR) repeat protein
LALWLYEACAPCAHAYLYDPASISSKTTAVFTEYPSLSKSSLDPIDIEIETPSLHGRRKIAYERAVNFIKAESFTEALAFIRRQPKDLREWRGLRSLEAALLSRDKPSDALLIYDEILNSKERDLHWTRALSAYRYLLKDLSAKGDYAARLRLIKCLSFEWKLREARDLLTQTLTEESLPEDIRLELSQLGAVLSVRQGDFDYAINHFQGKTDRSSLRWLSTVRLREGDFQEAARLRALVSESLKGKARLNEAVKVLDILTKGGLTQEALKLLDDHPELRDRVPSWAYYLGLSSMIEGKMEEAVDYFSKETTRSGERGQRALYFQGRAQEELLKYPEALLSYEAAIKGPLNYYQILSRGRHDYLSKVQTGARSTAYAMAELLMSPTHEDKFSMGFYLWLTERLPEPWPIFLEGEPPVGQGDQGRAKASIFTYFEGGDHASAMDELRHSGHILGLKGQSSEDVKLLTLMAAYSGEPHLAVTLMQNFKTQSEFPVTMRWNHPVVFNEELLSAYRRYGLPPQVTLSVIRTESAFQRDAVSRSNARGLMQLLPSTAQRLSEILGESSIHEEDLFLADKNIRYGTFYLSLLIRSFKSLALALCGYNGGPHNVLSSIAAREGLPQDLFIETFPFTETSNYVRTVLLSVYSYELAYLGVAKYPDLTKKVSLPEIPPPDF